jgi:hypothetical protein
MKFSQPPSLWINLTLESPSRAFIDCDTTAEEARLGAWLDAIDAPAAVSRLVTDLADVLRERRACPYRADLGLAA